MKRARAIAAFLMATTLGLASRAWGDSPVQDLTRKPSDTETAGTSLASKFAGSSAEVSSYVGSGSFYASGYRDPYVSFAVFVRPSYDLGTRYKLALRARIYVEEEVTSPDNKPGRRFYPYDPWLWLAADNLHTFERSKIRVGGVVRTVLPLSYESRYQNLLLGLGAGFNLNRSFELGQVADPTRKWIFALGYSFIFYKYLYSSDFRGNGPGDTTGCLAPANPGAPGVGGAGGPTASAADRCGGPANTNFALADALFATLNRGKWSASLTLLISNAFNYDLPLDARAAWPGVETGRTDTTWGILAAAYELRPHVSVTAGLSSYQPALDSRYRYPRFPFFDFSGANLNNYTQLFVSLSGSL